MNWKEIDKLNNAYYTSEIHRLFDVSNESHERIIQNLYRVTEYSKSQNTVYNNVSSKSKTSAALIGLQQLTKYFLWGTIGNILSLYQKISISLKKTRLVPNRKIDIVLISSPVAVDRFAHIMEEVFGGYNTVHFNFINQHNYKKLLAVNDDFAYIFPIIPQFNTLKNIFLYILEHRDKMIQQLSESYDRQNKVNLKLLDSFLIKTLIAYGNGKKLSTKFNSKYRKPIFLFDQDAGGTQQMLVEHLNQLNCKTVMIQHGIITDPKYYTPIARYMFCCSEREKDLLISNGVAQNRLFVYGTAFQNIVHRNSIVYDTQYSASVLVLASSGANNITEKFINTIKNSEFLKQIPNKALRLRPGDDEKTKAKWRKELSKYNIRENLPNTIEIANADIVITFSYDALIKCLALQKKVIVGIPGQIGTNPDLKFMEHINILRIARDGKELDKQLMELTNMSQEEYNAELDNNDVIIKYNFGAQRLEEVKTLFHKNINLIKNPNEL